MSNETFGLKKAFKYYISTLRGGEGLTRNTYFAYVVCEFGCRKLEFDAIMCHILAYPPIPHTPYLYDVINEQPLIVILCFSLFQIYEKKHFAYFQLFLNVLQL